MAFNFRDIGEKLSDAGQAATQKAKGMTETVKLNNTISDCQNKINALYAALGYDVYSKYADAPLPGTEDTIQQLNALHATVEDCRQQIQAINAASTCPGCGAKIKPGMVFCSNCGTKLPEPEAPAAEEEAIPQFCGNCGAQLSGDAAFCTSCGAKLN